jgi:hypothetical protein
MASFEMAAMAFGEPEQRKIDDSNGGDFTETWKYLEEGHRPAGGEYVLKAAACVTPGWLLPALRRRPHCFDFRCRDLDNIFRNPTFVTDLNQQAAGRIAKHFHHCAERSSWSFATKEPVRDLNNIQKLRVKFDVHEIQSALRASANFLRP